jgi:hypothetical protein
LIYSPSFFRTSSRKLLLPFRKIARAGDPRLPDDLSMAVQWFSRYLGPAQ